MPARGEAEMTNSPQVPAVKHLLQSKQRNAHLKETFTKSQNLKFVYFPFYKQDRTKKSSKSFQEKTTTGASLKKNEIEDTFKKLLLGSILNSATSQTWDDHSPVSRTLPSQHKGWGPQIWWGLVGREEEGMLVPVSGLHTDLPGNLSTHICSSRVPLLQQLNWVCRSQLLQRGLPGHTAKKKSDLYRCL